MPDDALSRRLPPPSPAAAGGRGSGSPSPSSPPVVPPVPTVSAVPVSPAAQAVPASSPSSLPARESPVAAAPRTAQTASAPEGQPPPLAAIAPLDTWRRALAAARWPDTLLGDDGEGHDLDLTHAHPSGLAILLAGRPTRLSSLIREPAAHAAARRQARSIRAAADELAADRGVRAGYLAAGLARWHGSGAIPVLLRGCSLRPRGAGHDDYELDLAAMAVVNPELLRVLRTDRGVDLDGEAVGGLAFGPDGFDPRPVYAYLEEVAVRVAGFRIERRLVVGSYASGSGALLADLEAAGPAVLAHPALGRITSGAVVIDPADLDPTLDPELAPGTPPAAPIVSGDRDLGGPGVALDLDPAQRIALTAVLAGDDVAIVGPPGSGLTQTLAGALAALTGLGRRVLVVTPHRATADALLRRLAEAGLGDLALDLHDGTGDRPGVLAGLASGLDAATAGRLHRGPSGVRDDGGELAELAGLGQALSGVTEALHADREPWGVSAYQAMVALAGLMGTENPPRTRVRLAPQISRRLDARERDRLRAELREAAQLGAFSVTRMQTRWLDARVRTDEQAREALAAARAARAGLEPARTAMEQVALGAGLAVATASSLWRPQLELLLAVRETLDVLLPTVFEQDVGDLIAATAPDSPPARDAGWLERRSLRRRARALVRPGVYVPDLHTRLVRAGEQREQWRRLGDPGGWPRVPLGLAQADAAVRAIETPLATLSAVLTGTGSPDLDSLPLDSLDARLGDLATDADGLAAQPRRTALTESLEAAGLGDLLTDLRGRRAIAEDVDGELDLAWWTSVLEGIIRSDPRLARHDPVQGRAQLERFADLDARSLQHSRRRILASVGDRAADVIARRPDQARWLSAEVHRGHRSAWPADLFRLAPEVVAALRPVWVMSPDAVARCLPAAVAGTPLVDVVMVDDAGQVGLAEAAASLARGRQVVVAGDPHRLPPVTGRPSVLDAVAAVGTVRRLDRAYRARDGRLLDPLLRAYPRGLAATPGAAGVSPLRLEYVGDGVGVPAPGEGAVISADAEVARVVDLVEEHALGRPGESLAVVALGTRHADRIEDALRTAVGERPGLARWLEVHWAGDLDEAFVVRPVHRIAGVERDAVIFTVGLARTPHGRVLHRFGVLDGRYGRACLLAALSRSRRRTTVVCCFTGDDLAPDRMRGAGPRLLREVLAVAGTHTDTRMPAGLPGPDALVADLRDRLVGIGLPVVTGVGAPDRPLDLAVADPAEPGRMLLAVDLDGPAHAACSSVRLRERQRREAFARAGWTYLRVASMDLFCDPASEVERVRRAWHAAGGPAPPTPATGIIVGRPRSRDAWPAGVLRGRPGVDYLPEELDTVVAWVGSDGVTRTSVELADAVAAALQLVRRGSVVDAAIALAVARADRTAPRTTS